jgi:gluconate 2-dehydrogenase alpha chain
MLDLADDNFDHCGLDFIGGAGCWFFQLGGYLGGAPGNLWSYALEANPNNIGSAFKATWKDRYLPTKLRVGPIGLGGPILPTTDHYADLDPHYSDLYGDPLARLTQDVDDNTYKVGNYLAPIVGKILEKMGCKNITVTKIPPGTQHLDAFGFHVRAGCRVGSNPETSVLTSGNSVGTATIFLQLEKSATQVAITLQMERKLQAPGHMLQQKQ